MNQNNNNAGFFIRFFATQLSMLVYFSMLSIPLFVSIMMGNSDLLQGALLTVALYMFSVVFYTAYIIYFVTHFGGELGKLLFGLKIVRSSDNSLLDTKTALCRQFPGYLFSGGFFGLGYFRVLKNPENLAWHDELFGTKVVREGSWLPGLFSTLILITYLTFFVYSLVLMIG